MYILELRKRMLDIYELEDGVKRSGAKLSTDNYEFVVE
jgi:hypothetical protein